MKQNQVMYINIAESEINCSAYIAVFMHHILLFWALCFAPGVVTCCYQLFYVD